MQVPTHIELEGIRYRVADQRVGPEGIDIRLVKDDAPALDWDAVKRHFDTVRKQYMDLQGLPGVNTTLALRLTFEPLAIRYNAGERTQELHDAMASVE